tara:strand:- start:1368 stop:1787 length:420 start_codon:yes stop_codon:yes gene_type:complete
MPTDYTNILFTNVLEPLATLINGEFSTPIYYDNKHRGNSSFLINIQSDELVTQLSYGTQREYNIEIVYQLKFGGTYNKNSVKQVSSIMERLKRLVNSNTSYGNQWFDGRISSIEYEQDEDDDSLLRSIAIFNCQNIEVL